MHAFILDRHNARFYGHNHWLVLLNRFKCYTTTVIFILHNHIDIQSTAWLVNFPSTFFQSYYNPSHYNSQDRNTVLLAIQNKRKFSLQNNTSIHIHSIVKYYFASHASILVALQWRISTRWSRERPILTLPSPLSHNTPPIHHTVVDILNCLYEPSLTPGDHDSPAGHQDGAG